jgi:hypothetical protein
MKTLLGYFARAASGKKAAFSASVSRAASSTGGETSR